MQPCACRRHRTQDTELQCVLAGLLMVLSLMPSIDSLCSLKIILEASKYCSRKTTIDRSYLEKFTFCMPWRGAPQLSLRFPIFMHEILALSRAVIDTFLGWFRSATRPAISFRLARRHIIQVHRKVGFALGLFSPAFYLLFSRTFAPPNGLYFFPSLRY